jgi:hypothetical protein
MWVVGFLAAAAGAVESARAPATRPANDMAAAIDRLLDEWRPRLEKDRFATAVAAPFVIAGDLPADELAGWRDRTVIPAARALAGAYFRTPPEKPVLILLFANEKSYRDHAARWLGDEDVPFYGYFRGDGVMLMNISTGGGTLVHEIVHALLRPDFPRCPQWINEGMGSLYEQCQLRPLRGLPNWRLPALQEAIREKKLRSLVELIADEDFYGEPHRGMNYAQARYLLMYLQELGKLQEFYRLARDRHAEDASGRRALESVAGGRDLAKFETDWRAWVLGLRFP